MMNKTWRWIRLAAAGCILVSGASGCDAQNSEQNSGHGNTQNRSSPATRTASAPGHLWHMKKAEIQQQIGGNDGVPYWGIPASPQKQVTALTIMIPTDWSFNGGVVLVNPNDCNFTAGRLGFNTVSADTTAGMVTVPSTVSMWTNDPSLMQSIQQNNREFGRAQVCKLEQPLPLAQQITEILHTLSKNLVPAGQMEPLPGVAAKLDEAVRQANQELARQHARITVEAGRIPLRNTATGATSEGYLTVMQSVREESLPNGASVWTIDRPLQVVSWAPQGKYAQYEAMYAAMLDSVWTNPEYTQAALRVSANSQLMVQQMKARISQIQQQMALDNLNAARKQAAIRADAQDYANHVYSSVAAHRSAALEHSAQQFSLYMGDQAQYHDPTTGGIVQLPSGANHVWASQTGNTSEYIMTDSPSYDPNGRVGNASWTEMQEVR